MKNVIWLSIVKINFLSLYLKYVVFKTTQNKNIQLSELL